MSDLHPSPSGGPELPPATPFDPEAGALPPTLEWSEARPRSAILLLDAAADRAWAADAAAAIAAAWAQAGRRVVLADLHLEEPVLHERLGEPNADGVVDVFLYGASLARTARPAAGRGFYFISSGTYTAEPDAVLRHPRWERIVAGFGDAQASLLLFVPAGAPGLGALARWAPVAIVLGEPDGAARESLPAALQVLAVAAPGGDGDSVPPPEVIPWSDPYEEREDPLLGEYAGGIPASTLPRGPEKAREEDLRVPPAVPLDEPEAEEAPPRRRWVLPLVVFLLGAVVVYGVVFALDEIRPGVLGGSRTAAAPAVPEETEVPAAPAAAPSPAGAALPYSVQAKAFASLPAARQMVEGDSARVAGTLFYVSPELVDQVLYYKVLAGAFPDTVRAAQLRDRLVEADVLEPADAQGAWNVVQFTPLAFDLGEFPDLAAARVRADSLLRLEVPAYPVAVPYSDGAERWRLYGGAFRDSVSAEGMRGILAERGIEARLVERTGG